MLMSLGSPKVKILVSWEISLTSNSLEEKVFDLLLDLKRLVTMNVRRAIVAKAMIRSR